MKDFSERIDEMTKALEAGQELPAEDETPEEEVALAPGDPMPDRRVDPETPSAEALPDAPAPESPAEATDSLQDEFPGWDDTEAMPEPGEPLGPNTEPLERREDLDPDEVQDVPVGSKGEQRQQQQPQQTVNINVNLPIDELKDEWRMMLDTYFSAEWSKLRLEMQQVVADVKDQLDRRHQL